MTFETSSHRERSALDLPLTILRGVRQEPGGFHLSLVTWAMGGFGYA